jgi:hypothetical protein
MVQPQKPEPDKEELVYKYETMGLFPYSGKPAQPVEPSTTSDK